MQQLEAEQHDCESPVVQALLHEVCVAAADERSKRLLCRAGLHKTLASLLFSVASCRRHDLAQAALCSLWNLAGPMDLRAEVAQTCVAHALGDTVERLGASLEILEWTARVAWLLAEDPSAAEVLVACNVPEVLERAAPGPESPEVQRWVNRAVCRMVQSLDQQRSKKKKKLGAGPLLSALRRDDPLKDPTNGAAPI